MTPNPFQALIQDLNLDPNTPPTPAQWQALVNGLHQAVNRETSGTPEAAETDAGFGKEKYRLQAVLENVGDGIITFNQDGIIQSYNPAAQRIFNCQTITCLHLPISQLFSKEALPATAVPELELLSQSSDIKRIRNRVTGRRADGTRFPMDMLVSEMVLDGEKQYIAVIRDITDELAEENRQIQQLRETILLDRAISTITSTQEPLQKLETICREISQAFGLPQAAVALLDDENKQLKVVAEYIAPGRPSALGIVIPKNKMTNAVLETRKPLAIPDTRTAFDQEELQNIYKQRGTISLLIIPLIIQDEVVGTIGLDSLEQRDFTESEIQLAMRVAATISQSIANARLRDAANSEMEARQRAEAALDQAQIHLSTIVNNSPIIMFALDEMRRIVLLQGMGLMALNILPESLVGRDIQALEPVIAGISRELDKVYNGHTANVAVRYADHAYELHYQPILNEYGRVEGAVGVAFDVTEREEMKQELENQLRETMLLNRVIATTTSAQSRQDILDIACWELGNTFSLPQVTVALFDAAKTHLVVAAEYMAPERPSALGTIIPLKQNPATMQVVYDRSPVVMKDARYDSRQGPEMQALAQERHTVSMLIVPLVVRDDVIGTLALSAVEERPFPTDEVHLSLSVAAAVGQALANASLLSDLQTQLFARETAETALQELSAIQQLLTSISANFINLPASELDTGITDALKDITQFTKIDRAYVFLMDNYTLSADGTRVYCQYDWADESINLSGIHAELLPYFLETLIDNPGVLYVDTENLPESAMPYAPYWQAEGTKTIAAIPLSRSQELIGFVSFEAIQTHRTWPNSYLPILRIIGEIILGALERKRYQEELEDQRDFALQIMNSMSQGLTVVDKHWNFEFVNPAYAKMIGTTPEELIGLSPYEFTVDDDHSTLSQSLRHRLHGQINQYETQIKRRDGRVLDVLISGTPRYHNDKIVGSISVITDLTERKQSERKLQQTTSELQAVFNALPDLYFRLDKNGLYLDYRAGKEEQLYQPPELFLGRSIFSILPYDVATIIQNGIDETIHAQSLVTIQYILNLPNGENHFEARLMPVLNDQVIALVRNITDQVRSEEAMRAAKEAAESAARAKSDFLANMSHEIRTPLNAITGMTGLLLDTSLVGEQQDFVNTIRSSSDGLLSIINDILDFSKIDAGRLELEQAPFNLYHCIEEALDLVAGRASDKGLDLAYYVEPTVPTMLVGDITRLRQILVNLLSNAVKFTSEGEVVVMCNGRTHLNKMYELHFSVKDSGIGIPPDRMDRLFQSFSQVDTSTTRKYGGTGLGLAICRSLTNLMGGRIWVESTENVGSTFHFTVQLSIHFNQPQLFKPSEQVVLMNKRVLIVDDNETNCTILSRQTANWQMKPTAVNSGAEALQLLATDDAFDIALLDMSMPEMDGLMLSQKIRQQFPQAAMPLILVSSISNRIQSESDLFATQLTKPVKPMMLYNALIRTFNGRIIQPEPIIENQIDNQLGKKHPLRILVAEDNAVNQKVICRILERLGYRADVAANGVEALEALQRQTYDTILMDVQMPEMDGVEATKAIKNLIPANKQPRIIAMTANALAGDREKYLNSGMDDYVSKPVRIPELISALRACPPNKTLGQTGNLSPEMVTVKEQLNGQMTEVWPIDRIRAAEIFGADCEMMLQELVPLYFEEATTLLQNCLQAVVAKDYDRLQKLAHTLKGSSGNLGLQSLAEGSQTLESCSKQQDDINITAVFDALLKEFNQVKMALASTYHLPEN